MIKLIVVNLLLLNSSMSFAYSGSGVGNGGDVVNQFVESSRATLLNVIKRIIANPTVVQGNYCMEVSDLSESQQQECHSLFKESLHQILKLNYGQEKTKITVTSKELTVENSDGSPRSVVAMTDLGPFGAIYYNYDRVKYLSPLQVLSVTAHEFLHKVKFNGGYITDNEVTEAFSSGRELIDSVASSYKGFAQKFGLIASKFTLFDHFKCLVYRSAEGFPDELALVTRRRFLQGDNYDNFVTSIGIHNLDPVIKIGESRTSMLNFSFKVYEQSGCDKDNQQNRKTEITLTREKRISDGSKEYEVVLEDSLLGFNPICSQKEKFKMEYENFSFECEYSGSDGSMGSN